MSPHFDPKDVRDFLSAYPLFKLRDELEETCCRVGEIFVPHTLKVVGKGAGLRASMDYLPLKDVSFSHLEYGAEITIKSDPFEDFLLIMLPLDASAEFKSGGAQIESNSRRAAVINPTSPLEQHWSSACDQLIVQIDRKAIERVCSAHLGRTIEKPIEFSLGMELTSGGVFDRVISLLVSSNGLAANAATFPILAANLEQLLINSLLLCHQHQYFDELKNPRQVVTPHYVKRAEEFMAEHAESPLTMKDVALHVGISLRSLYAGFERYRNMSPKTFLRNKRLDLAFADLLSANPEQRTTTVTAVALSRGFSHLGHFTKAYQERFGELPSDTLKKVP